MNELVFITDLDRTIIHSKNKGFLCVEKNEEKEITYMTEYSYDKLQYLLSKKEFKFVPCTMRNITQTLRVEFIREYDPKIIICTNGAQIYIDGKLDEEWDRIVKSKVDLNEVENEIDYIKKLDIKCEEIRNIEGFYITVKFEDTQSAKIGYEIISDKYKEYRKVLLIGVKVFVIHESIDKINAVDYVIDKFSMENIVTAGDTDVDCEFTKRGISILPKHSSFKHNKSIITRENGILATDEIVDFLKNRLKQE